MLAKEVRKNCTLGRFFLQKWLPRIIKYDFFLLTLWLIMQYSYQLEQSSGEGSYHTRYVERNEIRGDLYQETIENILG